MNINRFIDTCKELLNKEEELVSNDRAHGINTIKPSSVLLGGFALIYTISSVDIIPEKLIRPNVFGYIDDLIIVVIAIFFIYLDIGGLIDSEDREFGISDKEVQRDKESEREDSVPMDDKCIEAESLVIPTDDIRDNSDETTKSVGNDIDDILSNYFGFDDNDKND